MIIMPPCRSEKLETIKIGYFDHKPHQYFNEIKNRPCGATIVYFEMTAKRMGYNVEWVGPLPMFRLIQYLKEGTIDGTAHMVKTPDLKNIVYYADQPFHYAQPIFVVRSENTLKKISTIEDIKGYRVGWIGAVDDFPPSPFIEKHLEQIHIETVSGTGMWEQQLKKLLIGRVDAVHDLNEYTLLYEAKVLHINHKIRVLPLPEDPIPVLVMFSRNSSKGERLVRQYNTLFSEMHFDPADYYKLVDEEFNAL